MHSYQGEKWHHVFWELYAFGGGAVYWVMASDGKGEKWTLCVSGAREFDFDFRAL